MARCLSLVSYALKSGHGNRIMGSAIRVVPVIGRGPLRCDMARGFSQLLLGLRLDVYLMCDQFQQARDHREFVFGKQTNLQVKIRLLVGFRRRPILKNQDEGRKEDRFHLFNHRKQDETFVPCGNAGAPNADWQRSRIRRPPDASTRKPNCR
jgi:hypothetical protein